MRLVFWSLFGIGSLLALFGFALAQVPRTHTDDKTLEIVVDALAGLGLAVAFGIGRTSHDGERRAGPVLATFLVLELLFVSFVLWGVVTY
jgi:hypothetical protein